jgi:glutamate racemase
VVGVFDSGVGGLSVWREIVKLLPHERLIYLADQAHVPYGRRLPEELCSLTARCSGWLIERGCDIVVIACNTASGAALDHVRAELPHTTFVGMEPAVKPAALQTQTGVIGVLATEVTLKSTRYADLVSRFAGGARVIEQPCYGWVEFVEQGGVKASNSSINTSYVTALLGDGADAIVLGCTHFPFLSHIIAREIEAWRARHPGAPNVSVIDPAPAVAQQTLRMRQRAGASASASSRIASQPQHEFWTTGRAERFSAVGTELLGRPIAARPIDL